MKEYVVHAKIKNNLILSRILDQYPNVSVFCQATGLNQAEVGRFVNMRRRAIDDMGLWVPSALKLADALGELPDDLFTEEQAAVALKTNQAAFEISQQQMLEYRDPYAVIEDTQFAHYLLENAGLTDRERQAVEMRYMQDETLETVGKRFDVTRERARSISQNALNKLMKCSHQTLTGENLKKSKPTRRVRSANELTKLQEQEMADAVHVMQLRKAHIASRMRKLGKSNPDIKITNVSVRAVGPAGFVVKVYAQTKTASALLEELFDLRAPEYFDPTIQAADKLLTGYFAAKPCN